MGEQLAGVRKVVLLGWTGLVILVTYLRSASSQLGSSVLRTGRLSIGTTGATRPHVLLHPAGIQASLDFLSWQLGRIPTERKQGMKGLWRSEPGAGTSSLLHFSVGQSHRASPDSAGADIGSASCPPIVEAWSLNHWTTRKALNWKFGPGEVRAQERAFEIIVPG